MDIKRAARHLLTSPKAVSRAFPPPALAAIELAIAQSERRHRGQLRFAVEAALDAGALLAGQTPRERALEVFAQLGVWDTEENNGVLIYLLLADHDIEIVADRGIARCVPPAEWERVCRMLEARLKDGQHELGVVEAIAAATELLAHHFPPRGEGRNELPDAPVLIRGR